MLDLNNLDQSFQLTGTYNKEIKNAGIEKYTSELTAHIHPICLQLVQAAITCQSDQALTKVLNDRVGTLTHDQMEQQNILKYTDQIKQLMLGCLYYMNFLSSSS